MVQLQQHLSTCVQCSKLLKCYAAPAPCARRIAYKKQHGLRGILFSVLFCFVLFCFVLLACGVVVDLNSEFTPEDLRCLIDEYEAHMLIVDKRKKRLLEKSGLHGSNVELVLKELDQLNFGVTKEATWQQATSFDKTMNLHRRINLDLAEIIYTSSSTSKPKGVMLSHLNIVTNMHSIVAYLELNEVDRAMVILPFYYVYEKSLLLTHFLVAGSVVIDNGFTFPNKAIEIMAETEVTNFSGVPSTYAILLSRSNIRDVQLPHLRMVTQAGGAMAVTVQKEVTKVFAPAKLWVMYGATEAAPRLSYLPPEYLESKSGSIGRAVDDVELNIADETNKVLLAGDGGEIVARGSNLMMDYWKDESRTAQALENGCYHTGDLGYQDSNGFFYIVGRKSNIVKVKGFRISTK
ncbi:MAG: long-chain acyl-CoA synthetase [Lentisphaeria bacterium]|jgi:long-chain acyl-CoA synthetase